MLKKLDILTIKYFSGPFVVTFFLCLFVLLMQFLWKYVDDLVGKGLEWYLVFELLFFASANLVPMALPLAILLSGLMTMGNIAENMELMAFKSSGVSLLQVMKPLFITVSMICVFAFLFSNYLLPEANLKFGALMWDIKTKKPVLDIKPGIFYNEIDGYSIRIGEKSNKTSEVKDVLIYDQTVGSGNNVVIKAEKGEMLLSQNEKWLIMKLNNGSRYEEVRNSPKSYRTFPQSRTKFEEYNMRFDLSSFSFSRTNISLFKGNYKMLNMEQLRQSEDSVCKKILELHDRTKLYMKMYFFSMRDTLSDTVNSKKLAACNPDLIKNIPKNRRTQVMDAALKNARNIQQVLSVPSAEMKQLRSSLAMYRIEWHRKIILSFTIIMLFLIGAPLGAIIRKGGLGLPTVVSIFLFITYYIISIACEKLSKQFVLDPGWGMWLPVFLLLPIGFFLVYKANKDSMLFSTESYTRFINRLTRFFYIKRKNADTPDLFQDAISA